MNNVRELVKLVKNAIQDWTEECQLRTSLSAIVADEIHLGKTFPLIFGHLEDDLRNTLVVVPTVTLIAAQTVAVVLRK